MSGITGSFPFKMLVSQRTTRANRLHLSSLESKQLGVRFSNPNIVRIDCCRSFPSASQLSVTARSGGFRPGDQRRSRETQQANSGADPALDIFSIRSASVRLIDAQQNMVGVVSKTEAIQIAEEAELDLVILSPDADPPVVKIMDYNKYRYEQQKKKRDQQKKSAASRMDMKEVKMGYNIDSHDYSVRLKSSKKFLKDGDKVKIIVNLKGRENEFRNIAIELIKRFQNDVGEGLMSLTFAAWDRGEQELQR
ncbi:translation initiation factor IF3-2, chloroplastic-like isoform X2 [Telopea speciosissima]|uniref:translation initiation factor IF3-2, chloroplastic-like isoform X2 n=1 Tax=Telopea speciosissima TaxID=54955 RepID=UPI001CC3F5D3|nr:translation initiation factor IF3-2, chloroplastic-like isoform X2 [Telopea speciosissima]